MTEDRKRSGRSPSGSNRFASSALAERRIGPGAAEAGAPTTLDEALRALAAAKRELAAVRTDRNRLLRELAELGGMQTETIALGADEQIEESSFTLPTLDDLMAGLNTFEEAGSDRADDAEPEGGVMVAPELVFEPDDDTDDPRLPPLTPSGAARPAQGHAGSGNAPSVNGPAAPLPRANSRLLVFVDADPPIKYPLYKAVMTVGRSETADIRVDGDYISRVHARITTHEDGAVTVEDVASKNGIRVNGQEVKTHALRHGDVLSLGKLHFTFIDTSAAEKA